MSRCPFSHLLVEVNLTKETMIKKQYLEDDFKTLAEYLRKFGHRLPEYEQRQIKRILERHRLDPVMPWQWWRMQ